MVGRVVVRQRSLCSQWTGVASEFCAELSVLPEFSAGFSMLLNAHFEPAALCAEVSVHTAVPGASQCVNLLQKLLL